MAGIIGVYVFKRKPVPGGGHETGPRPFHVPRKLIDSVLRPTEVASIVWANPQNTDGPEVIFTTEGPESRVLPSMVADRGRYCVLSARPRHKAVEIPHPYVYDSSWNGITTVAHHGQFLPPDNVILHAGSVVSGSTLIDELTLMDMDHSADSDKHDEEVTAEDMSEYFERLNGSGALAVCNDDRLVLRRDHLPMHIYLSRDQVVFSTTPIASKHHGDYGLHEVDFPPHSTAVFSSYGRLNIHTTGPEHRNRAISILSGGLDSCVTTHWAMLMYRKVDILHAHYGAAAEEPEQRAVNALVDFWRNDTKLHRRSHFEAPAKVLRTVETVDLGFLRKLGGSTLTSGDSSKINTAVGAGTTSVDWVPARNMVLLAAAAAMADARKCGSIVMGLHEGFAYADNSQTFTDAMAQAIDLGTKCRARVVVPIATMNKRLVVALGLLIDAPMHLSWSCYKNGPKHCGQCGPCRARQTAFLENGTLDSVEYENPLPAYVHAMATAVPDGLVTPDLEDEVRHALHGVR